MSPLSALQPSALSCQCKGHAWQLQLERFCPSILVEQLFHLPTSTPFYPTHRVLKECPYKGGYDLSVATSKLGAERDVAELVLPRYSHALVVFGGAKVGADYPALWPAGGA
jgi:hypothetical protein